MSQQAENLLKSQFWLCHNGKNETNIIERVSKGMGTINKIFSILDSIAFGSHYFEIALLLRRSLLISSALTNCEVWYNVSKKDIKDLSVLDRTFFLQLFSLPKTSPEECFVLKFGELDFATEIKARRLIYIQNLMTRKKEQLLSSILQAQIVSSSPGDWILQVYKDMEDLEMPQEHK